ncbi:MAG: restriction endonuclease [Polyangiaceae bacterium]
MRDVPHRHNWLDEPEAVASGIRNARIVIGLAFVTAALEGASSGATVLNEICTQAGVQWTRAIEFLNHHDASESDPLTMGFVMGINQGSAWTRLGTFANRFLHDATLAEGLYRTAERLEPRDPVTMTNLARLLVQRGEQQDLEEARRFLQRAKSSADRRFTWWRIVQEDLDRLTQTAVPQRDIKVSPTLTKKNAALIPETFRELHNRFRVLDAPDGVPDRQARGYELEQLIFDLARLTLGTAAPAYRIRRSPTTASQIDGYFEHPPNKYRLECKWEEKPAGRDHITIFAERLDAVGVDGLFISMSGFSDSAIERAKDLRKEKAILLMDGNEVRLLFSRRLMLDEAMQKKRLYFDQYSDPYHPVQETGEATPLD